MADVEKPSFLRTLAKATAGGVAAGSAFFVLGSVANPMVPAITGLGLAIVGFASGFAVALADAY